MGRRHKKFFRWSLSEKQIELLWLISKTKNIGIDSRRGVSKIIFGDILLGTRRGHAKSVKRLIEEQERRGIRTDLEFYYDESNFNKAIKSLVKKDLIYRKKESIISKGNIVKKYCYYLTKKGKMFLKII